MVNFGYEWFPSGKTQKTQGFYRGSITRKGVTRFTLRKFSKGEDAELHALNLALRYRRVFQSASLPMPGSAADAD